MSKVGDIDKMYGKNFSVVTTNASGADIIGDTETSFVASALIIASPVDSGGNDIGCPSVLATDADGKPIRLTYTIQPGNGLVLAYTKSVDDADVISFAIDNDTLKTSEEHGAGYLYVSASGITENSQYIEVDDYNNIDVALNELHDAYRLVVTHVPKSGEADSPMIARLTVDASKLIDNVTLQTTQPYSTAVATYFFDQRIAVNTYSLVDNDTVQIINDKNVITVNTQHLQKATSHIYGTVKIDNKTIKIKKDTGAIYVDEKSFKALGPSGGVGLVRYHGRNDKEADIIIDDNGFVHTNVAKMQKANVVNANSAGGFGVCAADGVTITALTDGVLKVLTSGLEVATKNKPGIVKPDDKTIKIEQSGVISVNAANLPIGSASTNGLVKYDDSTIVKNSQGQLSVANASSWSSAIADLNTRISSFTEQLASLRADLANVLAKIGQGISAAFNLFTTEGKPLQSMRITIPNIASFRNGTHQWDTSDCGGTFKIQYAAGYVFSCRLVGGSSSKWMQGCKIIVNGQAYGMDQDIKLSGNEAICSLQFSIQGYGTAKLQRPTGSWTIEFKDNSGNPLKSFLLTISSAFRLIRQADFIAVLNGKDITDLNTVQTTSALSNTSLTELVRKDNVFTGGTTMVDGKLVVKNPLGKTTLTPIKK